MVLTGITHAQLIDNGNGTITDTETELTWQQDTARDGQGGYRLTDWNEALFYCQTLDLGDYKDWRLPTIIELETIADLSVFEPAIDSLFSSNTALSDYWSSTTEDDSRNYAWTINFKNGTDGNKGKTTSSAYVRAVRGGTITPKPQGHYRDNGNGTVTDTKTGLIWQKDTAKNSMSWSEALAYCESLKLGERWTWRLPTIKELESIVDLSVCVPAIDLVFQDTKNGKYWTSTTEDDSRTYAWIIDFAYGSDGVLGKSNTTAYVRAVCGGVTILAYVSKVEGCGGNNPCYSNIQDALNAVEDGAIIRIGQGYFLEPYALNKPKTITLQGGWDPDFTTQTANNTFLQTPQVLDGGLVFQCLTFKTTAE